MSLSLFSVIIAKYEYSQNQEQIQGNQKTIKKFRFIVNHNYSNICECYSGVNSGNFERVLPADIFVVGEYMLKVHN